MSDAPWMAIGLGELGVTEIPGPKSNSRIDAYAATTTLAATNDDVPWCSSFVNWCITQTGRQGTRSAAARSWERYGTAVLRRYGAIIVLERGQPGQGHVGFYVDEDDQRVFLLGGNQGNRVSVAAYVKDRIVACRWP